jgi:maltooligosyltrehalose synthase
VKNIEDKNQGMDIEQMLQTAKLLGDLLKPTEEKKEDKTIDTGYIPLAFDEEIQSSDMKVIKAVIPFMPLSQQKIIGVAIKLMEIKNILDKSEETTVAMTEDADKDTWHKEILIAVKPYCNEEKQNMLNAMIRMLEMKRILVQLEALKEVL